MQSLASYRSIVDVLKNISRTQVIFVANLTVGPRRGPQQRLGFFNDVDGDLVETVPLSSRAY